MGDRKQFTVGNLAGGMTVPWVLSSALAVSILFNQFMVTAGVLVGACLILFIVRGADQRNEPLRDIVEVVLRNESQDSVWVEELRQKHRDANENTIRTWRQYTRAAWIVLAAMIIKVGWIILVAVVE